jgi:hypothetical protein
LELQWILLPQRPLWTWRTWESLARNHRVTLERCAWQAGFFWSWGSPWAFSLSWVYAAIHRTENKQHLWLTVTMGITGEKRKGVQTSCKTQRSKNNHASKKQTIFL